MVKVQKNTVLRRFIITFVLKLCMNGQHLYYQNTD